nr:MAG TPA: hypothetical protein [Caudoviricetes sp.]
MVFQHRRKMERLLLFLKSLEPNRRDDDTKVH